jgi:hypothetical protein
VHLQGVEQFDARHRDAELDGLDHRLHRALHVGKEQVALEIASGMPCSRTVTSVMTPSVPSEPTNRRVRS